MKFIRVFPFLLLTSIVGCINAQQNHHSIDDHSSQIQIQNLPKVELTSSIFYGILASEIAAQRGGAIVAAKTYLHFAQVTDDPRLAQRATELAIAGDRQDLAMQAARFWQSLDTNSNEANKKVLFLRLYSGEMLNSQPQIDNLLKFDAKATFTLIAITAANQQNKMACFLYVQKLIAKYKWLPEAQFALLATASEANQQKVVDASFDRLSNLDPKWDLPVTWQLDRLRNSDLNKGIIFLKRELDRRHDAGFDLQIAYPKMLLMAKRHAEARASLLALLKRYPEHPDLLYATGYVFYEDKDFIQADKYLKLAISKGYKDQPLIDEMLGSIAYQQHKLIEARSLFEKILPSQPPYFFAQVHLAIIDTNEGKFDQALNRIDKLPAKTNEIKEEIALFKINLASLSKRNQLAWSIASKSIKKFPKSTQLLYARSVLSEKMGRYTQAERDLRAYLKIDPNSSEALNGLGYTLTEHTNRYAEAHSYIAKALQLSPKNSEILDSMGWVLFKQGNAAKALPYLEQAWSSMQNAEIAAHLGEVLFVLGKKDESLEIWKKGYSLDSKNTSLLKTMRRFGVNKP